ncbi:hypothetical protein Sste5346_005580 [Sporothrix stenoceras]|uniref:Uncharacterized protein n=1 Tax=Sporothrix stenoceras TaxID=5173 RepID=A0ABR3Z2N7_9PEZI
MSGYPYPDREPDFGHDNSPQYTCSADSPNKKIFGRTFSKSTTPSAELSCRMRSVMRLKRPTSDSEDDEEQEDGTGKKARLSDDPTSPVVFEFACPFYKRNRHKYCHQRSCRTSGWPSVHRVNVPEDAGFDLEIEKKLRSRKKIDGQNESDKWTHMYRLLFPSYKDKTTPSPYVDYSLRDEPALTAPREADAELTQFRPKVDKGSLMTVAAAAVAAEQKTTTSETLKRENTNEGMMIDFPSMLMGRQDQAVYQNIADDSRLVPKSEFYKIVQDHVLTVLSNIPNAPVPPSAKAQ